MDYHRGGDYYRQSQPCCQQGYLQAMAADFSGRRRYGVGRDRGPAGRAKAPALHWLSALGAIRHFGLEWNQGWCSQNAWRAGVAKMHGFGCAPFARQRPLAGRAGGANRRAQILRFAGESPLAQDDTDFLGYTNPGSALEYSPPTTNSSVRPIGGLTERTRSSAWDTVL